MFLLFEWECEQENTKQMTKASQVVILRITPDFFRSLKQPKIFQAPFKIFGWKILKI